MERVGMGVVGAGSIGIRAALMHLSLEDVQDRVYLAAVCDPVPGGRRPPPRPMAWARPMSVTKTCWPIPMSMP